MSNGVNNFVDNSELVEYLKSRKNVQTEVEMKSIMGKIYECVAMNSKLFYAFNVSVPPTTNEEGEMIFDKTVNSPFRDTGLLEYLQSKGETELIATGLQTDYCMDATVKCGFEHGFKVYVPACTNSTFDNAFMTAE